MLIYSKSISPPIYLRFANSHLNAPPHLLPAFKKESVIPPSPSRNYTPFISISPNILIITISISPSLNHPISYMSHSPSQSSIYSPHPASLSATANKTKMGLFGSIAPATDSNLCRHAFPVGLFFLINSNSTSSPGKAFQTKMTRPSSICLTAHKSWFLFWLYSKIFK